MATKRPATTPTGTASKAKDASTVKATPAKAPPTKRSNTTPKAAPAKRQTTAAKAAPARAPTSKAVPAPARSASKSTSPAKSPSPTKRAVSTPTSTTNTSATTARKTAAVRKAPATTNGSHAPKATSAPVKVAPGPYATDDKFLEEQRVLLLEERAVYQGQAEDLRAEADSLAQEREPGDVQFDEESGEGGTVAVDRERDLALSAQALAAVEEVDNALQRIDRKTYGTCERCREAIPKARLKALPYARLCVSCKSGGLSRR